MNQLRADFRIRCASRQIQSRPITGTLAGAIQLGNETTQNPLMVWDELESFIVCMSRIGKLALLPVQLAEPNVRVGASPCGSWRLSMIGRKELEGLVEILA